MCGFLGRINPAAREGASPRPLAAAASFLSRRGPDSTGEWKSSGGRVELLHARLAIVDADERARQPFKEMSRGIVLVFNGEIYNHEELRKELRSYPFSTSSDTEVLAALFARQGLEGLKKIRGMFALAIVDEESRRVYLARDPVGKKPLYLARWHDGIYFGSTLLSMAAASGMTPAPDSSVFADFWRRGYVPPPRSVFRDSAPVMPGRFLEMDWDGRLREVNSCEPPFSPEAVPQRPDEITGRISFLLEQSVRRRLHHKSRPLCLLSGGIDSTVVASEMKKNGGGCVLTVGSGLPVRLEEKYARYAARRLDLPIEIVRPRPGKLAEEILWAIDLQDEPLGVISFFPLALLVRSAKEHGKILLTGDGGDEVFLGYGHPNDWVSRSDADAGPRNGDSVNVGGPTPPWMSEWGREMLTVSLLGHMFAKLDRASAEQGVETRCPLLDWDLLRYVRSLPPEILFFNGRTKALLKNELQGWPAWFVNRPKRGFPYHLRWEWGLKGFQGLRDLVNRDSVEAFEPFLPMPLKRDPSEWSPWAIFHHFPSVWKLLVWSRFSERLKKACRR